MGIFSDDIETEPSEGFNYSFGESAAVTLQRWSKLLIQLQQRVEALEEENKQLKLLRDDGR